MSSLSEKLYKWVLQELNLVSERPLNRIPEVSDLNCVLEGKNRKIWVYVVNHIRSRTTVRKIKRTLALKRQLEENDDDLLNSYFKSDKVDFDCLRQDIKVADGKRAFLETSVSVVGERILSTEQHICNIKNDLLKVNQKCAFLDLLTEKYKGQNESLKVSLNEISHYLHMLNANHTSHISSDSAQENEITFENIDSKAKTLINRIISLMEAKLVNSSIDSGELCHLQNDVSHLLNSVGLPKFLPILKKLCHGDLEIFLKFTCNTNPVHEFIKEQKKNDPYDRLLEQLKHRHFRCCVDIREYSNKLHELSDMREKVLNKFKTLHPDSDDPDLLIKLNLMKTLSENEGFVEGNKYLNGYFREQQNIGEMLSKKLYNQKLKTHDFKAVTQKFSKNASIAYMLTQSASNTFMTINKLLGDLKSSTDTEMCNSVLSLNDYPVEFERLIKSDMEMMWTFADQTDLFKVINQEPFKSCYPLSKDVISIFNILPFQNIGIACNKLLSFKRYLHKSGNMQNISHVSPNQMDLSDKVKLFIDFLNRMEDAVQKGALHVDKAFSCSDRCSVVLNAWLEQSAQFILPIECKGKSLKTWIDILKVLPDFQSQYLPCKT